MPFILKIIISMLAPHVLFILEISGVAGIKSHNIWSPPERISPPLSHNSFFVFNVYNNHISCGDNTLLSAVVADR